MCNILVVSPFSGKTLGGGLAILNQDLTVELARRQDHSVKLLTLSLPDKYQEAHGLAQIVFIDNDVAKKTDPTRDADRNLLYELINSKDVLLSGKHLHQIIENEWIPDLIIGHSRFSGPAAVMLRDTFYTKARVAYFLHSYPVEGSILVGHKAFGEEIGVNLAQQKIAQEKEWMPKADIVVAMGPLLRAGASLILEKAGKKTRIHEAISGLPKLGRPRSRMPCSPPVQLLLLGRANAAIKGLDDMIETMRRLREANVDVEMKVLGWTDEALRGKKEESDEKWTASDVQHWVDGVLQSSPDVDVPVSVLPSRSKNAADLQAAHVVLSPSYIEHFGLVPFEALSLGVPTLVSEFSGAGMFLADEQRFGDLGLAFVVRDFNSDEQRPLDPIKLLQGVPENAFDERPARWADAIKHRALNIGNAFDTARLLREKLNGYTMEHFVTALLYAALESTAVITVQGADGQVIDRS